MEHPDAEATSRRASLSSVGSSSSDSNHAPSSGLRTPKLQVSHKLAERRRRKEMKELFETLRDAMATTVKAATTTTSETTTSETTTSATTTSAAIPSKELAKQKATAVDEVIGASKWEILSRAIDLIEELGKSKTEAAREIEELRAEVVRLGGAIRV